MFLLKGVKAKGYPSEQLLLVALGQGDRQALEFIYRTYWPMVAHLVRGHKGSEREAEDVHQEGIIVLYEQARQNNFHLTCSLKTYLYSICRNKWFNQLKARREMTGIEQTDMECYEEHIFPESVERATPLPIETEIKQAIAGLGEPCRALLMGFYYQKLNLDQLAHQLHYASANVAKQRKFRCLERLKKQFLNFAPTSYSL